MFAERTWRGVLVQRTPPLRAVRSGDTVWSIKREGAAGEGVERYDGTRRYLTAESPEKRLMGRLGQKA